VKLNSALKNTDTDLPIGMQTRHSSGAITGMEGTCCHPQSEVRCFCIAAYHRKMSWVLGQHHNKTVMITDVLPMTRKDLAQTSFKHQ
jgi:hypothetical protein